MSKKNNIPSVRKPSSVGGVKIVASGDINEALSCAAKVERLRSSIEIQDEYEEIPQRFINCLVENSYVRPHMHVVPNQWEMMTWLHGEVAALFFDDHGKVVQKIVMGEEKVKIIEVPPFCYHTFYVRGKGAYLEVRNCKYQPNIDRVYATWAPPENSSMAKAYHSCLLTAEVGDTVTLYL